MLAADGYGLLPINEVDAQSLENFDCGKPRLNEFLFTTSRPSHEHRLGLTSIVFHSDVQGPVGYFTLSNDGIPLSPFEFGELGTNDENLQLSAFPAVKIGRLAVHHDHQGDGVGAAIIRLIRGEVLDSESLSGARLLVVDADNDERVIRFYEKQGFERSLWADKINKNHKGRLPNAVKMIRDVLKD